MPDWIQKKGELQMNGWIGVDLDGTLAEYNGWHGIERIGEPIQPMIRRVKEWIASGKKVKIFTARVFGEQRETALQPILDWCKTNIGCELEVTCEKDFGMIELWDDRCVQVITNKGEFIGKTNEYPDGKLNNHDEGELRIAVTVKGGRLIIDFGKQVKWLGFDKKTAQALLETIKLRMDELR